MIDQLQHNGVITPEELHNLLHAAHGKQPKLLDATFVLPNSVDDPKQGFAAQHLENAQYFDIETICDPNNPLPHMLPTAQDFEKHVRELGIENDDFVVIYGQSGMVMGPARAWWMFHAFGHDNVAVLDGGLPAWLACGYTTSNAPSAAPAASGFTAGFNPNLIVSREEMHSASNNPSIQIYDARPPARFGGHMPEPREGLQSGHIPTSHNIPASQIVDEKTGRIKSRAELESLFMIDGWDYHKKTYTTCGSGVTACMLALALYNLGAKDVAVYDGSWSEWGQKSLNMPISRV